MPPMMKLRENLSGESTRWLTVATLVSVVVAAVGVVLNILIMWTSATGQLVRSDLSAWAMAVTAVGVISTVFFAIALNRKNAQ